MADVYYEYDGTPHLVMNIDDLQQLPDEVTQTPPPNGLYRPFYYEPDTDEWFGNSEEDFMNNIIENEEIQEDIMNENDSNIREQLEKQNEEIAMLKTLVSNLTLSIAQGDGLDEV